MMTQQRWHKLSLSEQLGNIGSEVTKAFFWKDKDKSIARERAQTALELFDLTIEDARWRSKLKELLKLRGVFCDCFFELGNFTVRPETLKKYFIPFAILANKRT